MTNRRRLLALALVAPIAAVAATSAIVATAAAGAIAATAARGAIAAASSFAPVEALDQGILAVMRAGRSASFAQRMQMLTPVVQAAFDLPRILANSVGLRFAGFPPDAQAELLDVFTQFTVASYVANFDDYSGERFDVLPDTRRAGSDDVVQTKLVQTNGEILKLDYVVHRGDGGWRIVDVLLNGSISRVAVQRSDFRALLGGGEAGPLIGSLRDKVARLAAGQTD